MEPELFPNWTLELARRHSAIIVSADYRLLPESNGHDILDDVIDLWEWVRESLQTYFNDEYAAVQSTAGATPEIDFGRILAVGESAGGYLALQSVLSQPAGFIKVLLCQYAVLNVANPFFTTKFDKPLFGVPMLPTSVVDDHIVGG